MITFVEILIFFTAMFFVGYPIFKKNVVRGFSLANRSEAEALHYSGLTHKKELAYTAIKDLEFDYRTGKLSESDYNDLKGKYETEALHILKQIDESGKKIPLSSTLPPHPECPTLQGGDEWGVEIFLKNAPSFRMGCGGLLKGGQEGIVFCSKCGTKTKTGDNFCSKCGAKLS